MKKFTLFLLLFITALTTNAQFEQGTKYVGASTTGLGFNYSSNEKFRFGLDVETGYFLADCFMLKANLGYEHTRNLDDVRIGAGFRYYFEECGVYLGAGAEFNHFTKSNNDVMIPLQVGATISSSRKSSEQDANDKAAAKSVIYFFSFITFKFKH